MITAFISHPYCDRHHMGPAHPESPQRLESIRSHMALAGVLQQTMQADARQASDEQISRIHPLRYLKALARCVPDQGLINLDNDTLMNPDSLKAARYAAGAAVAGVDRVFRHQADNVFCAVRPPGHHAELSEAMGFCFFNNVAVAAAHARAQYGIRRVAIIDFDVHQCNGTIDIFGGDPDTLICTSYQYPFYPWRYLRPEFDNVVDTPLEAGCDGATFRARVERDWLPALQAHRPELVLVSAGFDAHRDDPLADICLDETDYHWVTTLLMDVARSHADNRLVSVLEGGYSLEALGRSATAHVRALLGQPYVMP
ncbi:MULTISPECIES: histone deacetylase family protein [Modicisalibacter]|uniref:histone deacetylase family protein n=1 Tax=Modicisalibacter TaxID=574347 RepID=UPI00100ACDA3|nr:MULTISPECIES: histone deacetylase family protein [Halomonadaceae]MBZ9556683.1 histone deacetylase family protein [Modicisalibacter sp. R2A 31.J]MBZ9574848.1 histone deacetylase family protein [Modicisalibacter sp. MOD 31.J]